MARSQQSIREIHVTIEDMESRIRSEAEAHATIISSQLNSIRQKLDTRQPSLFGGPPPVRIFRSNRLHRVMAAAANVMGLLPSTAFFIFSAALPALSDLDGSCSRASRTLVLMWLVFCTAICVLASFTDSSRGSDGNIYFGIITPYGLRRLTPNTGEEKLLSSALTPIDFVHSILSLLVFCAFTFTQAQVRSCIIPGKVAHSTNIMINLIPLAVAFICSVFFHYLPSKRRGLGSFYP